MSWSTTHTCDLPDPDEAHREGKRPRRDIWTCQTSGCRKRWALKDRVSGGYEWGPA